MAGENPGAKQLKKNADQAKGQNQPKSILHHSKGKKGKGKKK